MSGIAFVLPPIRTISPYSWEEGYKPTEAEMRGHFALTAWLAGWDISVETKMPGGGRADLILNVPPHHPTIIIEFKLSLCTQREYRQGLQQVDGYRRMSTSQTGTIGILCGDVVVPSEAASELVGRYPRVQTCTAGQLGHLIEHGFNLGGKPERTEVQRDRLDAVTVLSALAAHSEAVPA